MAAVSQQLLVLLCAVSTKYLQTYVSVLHFLLISRNFVISESLPGVSGSLCEVQLKITIYRRT